MRAVVQRVLRAEVSVVEGEARREVGRIGNGLLILVGVRTDDTEADARALADKIAGLRILEDEAGRLNLSLLETGGSALVVSNFTLYGDCRKGRRPSFTEAAPGPLAQSLYESFGSALQAQGVPVQYGAFGAEMQVMLVNDGPVTLLLDSRRIF
jgi:D-tyrosyl-tRNA(Tyr) deacylase